MENNSPRVEKLQAKYTAEAKRGKIHEIDYKRGKICKRCQATENAQTLNWVG